MLSVEGKHNGAQVFCDVVLMPIEPLDGTTSNINGQAGKKLIGMRALMDTGATHTCITSKAAERLDLDPLGYIPTTGIHGTELQASVDFDILLGMDVISCGNLFVYQNGLYRFEFDDIGTPTY